MSARRVWIVGAGRRVRETALPALRSLRGTLEVAGVLARTARELEAAGARWAVRALEAAQPSDFADGDVLYVAVGKDAMPEVLARLASLDRPRLELLVDTPVLKLKHLRCAPLLAGWLRASVAEDVAYLPWYEAARAASGPVRAITFDRSAYAYHGFAAAKALSGARRVLRVRRARTADGARREIELEGGVRVTVLEPRDYARGRVLVAGERVLVADRFEAGETGLRLEVLLERGRCVGFRAGECTTRLDEAEIALQGADLPDASVTARMDSMKRIAFRRLAAGVAAGRGGYPLEDGLEDSAVEGFVERFGRWRAGGPCDVRRPLVRAFWSALGRLA
ncbi:MAG: hypothetical protein JNK02_06675 [Planctomycetes bacterium]|nr:hypothetical protein [Planctomycetota bacterium]